MSEQRTEWEKAQAAPSEILFEMAEAYLKSVQSEPPSQFPTEGAAGESVPKSARSAGQVSEHSVHATTAVLASLCADLPTPRERGAGSVFAVDYARDHPDALLRPINAAKLLAMGTLLEEAREAVQRVAPKTPQDAERCLRPAISKYAKELFDRRAEVKLRDAGSGIRSGVYGRWLRSKCLPKVVDDVCMFDGLFQITVRHVADYIGDGYPAETFRALWGILAREFEPDSFRPGMEARIGAELEARSLYWEGQVPRSERSATRKAKATGAHSTGADLTSAKGSSAPTQTKTAMGESRPPKAVRLAVVVAFLLQCNQHTIGNAKIKKKHIWLAAGHKHARQFQYWQIGSNEATNEDDRNFGRLLSMAPADFIALLIKKAIISASS